MKNKPNKLWFIVIALGWLFDFLFWKKAPGINFAIFQSNLCDRSLLSLVQRWPASASRRPRPVSVVRLFCRCDIHSRRADDHLSCLHIHALHNDRSCTDLPRRALDSIHHYGFPRQVSCIDGKYGSVPSPSVEVRKLQGRRENNLQNTSLADPAWHDHRCPAPWRFFAALLSSADVVFGQQLENLIKLFNWRTCPNIFSGWFIFWSSVMPWPVLFYMRLLSRKMKSWSVKTNPRSAVSRVH